MNPDHERLERLIIMAQRLTDAMQADIDAIKAGRPQEMRSLDPEIQRLLLLYGREVKEFDPGRTKAAPAEMKKRLSAVTGKFRDMVTAHQRLLTRVRNASEGIVKAVAEEVQRKCAPSLTYAPAQQAQSAYRKSTIPMLYNSTV